MGVQGEYMGNGMTSMGGYNGIKCKMMGDDGSVGRRCGQWEGEIMGVSR